MMKTFHDRKELSMETLKAKRVQTLKGHRRQPRLLYSAKLSFEIDGETKTFHDKIKFK